MLHHAISLNGWIDSSSLNSLRCIFVNTIKMQSENNLKEAAFGVFVPTFILGQFEKKTWAFFNFGLILEKTFLVILCVFKGYLLSSAKRKKFKWGFDLLCFLQGAILGNISLGKRIKSPKM